MGSCELITGTPGTSEVGPWEPIGGSPGTPVVGSRVPVTGTFEPPADASEPVESLVEASRLVADNPNSPSCRAAASDPDGSFSSWLRTSSSSAVEPGIAGTCVEGG